MEGFGLVEEIQTPYSVIGLPPSFVISMPALTEFSAIFAKSFVETEGIVALKVVKLFSKPRVVPFALIAYDL
jgi:hypothetical protein